MYAIFLLTYQPNNNSSIHIIDGQVDVPSKFSKLTFTFLKHMAQQSSIEDTAVLKGPPTSYCLHYKHAGQNGPTISDLPTRIASFVTLLMLKPVHNNSLIGSRTSLLLLLWHCWLDVRNSMWLVKVMRCWCVICLE